MPSKINYDNGLDETKYKDEGVSQDNRVGPVVIQQLLAILQDAVLVLVKLCISLENASAQLI